MGAGQSDTGRRQSSVFSIDSSFGWAGCCPSILKKRRCTKRNVKLKLKTINLRSLALSPCYYDNAMRRESSDLKRNNSNASLIPRIFRTPVKNRRKENKRALRWKSVIDANDKDQWKKVALCRKLKNLTKEQLSDLVLLVTSTNPQIELEFHENCPQPDIMMIKSQLLQLLDCIYKAFPKYHIGSMRDGFCYEMVVLHIEKFQNECFKYCEEFYKDRLLQTVIEYILMTWPIVNRLPEWNNDESNAIKRSLLYYLVSRLRLAIRATECKREAWILIKNRIEDAAKLDGSIMPALDDINELLDFKK